MERYPYLGGLASGGMVLVLDDMHNDTEISVRGLAMEIIERMHAKGLCVYPPEADRDPAVRTTEALWRKWSRWGVFDFYANTKPYPIIFSASFDPDGFKQASLDMVREAGVELRLHSWFQSAIVEDGRAAGVIVETKEGAQAIRGSVIVDATGDLDVAASAGAAYADGAYIVTTVSRMGGVDTEEAERFQFEEPERFAEIDLRARRLIGGCWQHWWLKTPLPGIVWCNCPHMSGFDGLKVADLTAAEFEGRRRMQTLLEFAREHVPGFGRAYFVDFAPQTGVRQTRLLEGEYVVTKRDVKERVHFHDSVCRGRDIDKLRGVVSGKVTIATLDSLNVQFLPEALAEFIAAHPAVQIRVMACDPIETMHAVAQGAADLGLTFSPAWRRGITVLKDVPCPMCAIMAPDHALAARKTLSLDECGTYRLMYQDHSGSMQLFFGEEMEAFKNAHKPVAISNTLAILKRLLLRGVGIAFYTRLGFAEELASGRLVAVPLEEEPLSTLRLCLIAPSERLPTVAAGAMAEHLREALIRFTTDDPRDLHR